MFFYPLIILFTRIGIELDKSFGDIVLVCDFSSDFIVVYEPVLWSSWSDSQYMGEP